MKKILYITLSLLITIGITGCNNWLDVNVDPDNPNNASATVDSRLPWIQHYYMYAWGNASMRGVTIAGLMTQTSTTTANGLLSAWNPSQAATTTTYQNWFIGAACNLDDMIEAAEKTSAYHYIGAPIPSMPWDICLWQTCMVKCPIQNLWKQPHSCI